MTGCQLTLADQLRLCDATLVPEGRLKHNWSVRVMRRFKYVFHVKHVKFEYNAASTIRTLPFSFFSPAPNHEMQDATPPWTQFAVVVRSREEAEVWENKCQRKIFATMQCRPPSFFLPQRGNKKTTHIMSYQGHLSKGQPVRP